MIDDLQMRMALSSYMFESSELSASLLPCFILMRSFLFISFRAFLSMVYLHRVSVACVTFSL